MGKIWEDVFAELPQAWAEIHEIRNQTAICNNLGLFGLQISYWWPPQEMGKAAVYLGLRIIPSLQEKKKAEAANEVSDDKSLFRIFWEAVAKLSD